MTWANALTSAGFENISDTEWVRHSDECIAKIEQKQAGEICWITKPVEVEGRKHAKNTFCPLPERLESYIKRLDDAIAADNN